MAKDTYGLHEEVAILNKQVERLEREVAVRQERINRAVRDLDHIAYLLASPRMNADDVRQQVLDTQTRLRGRS